jgi:hypothetical protein
MKSKRWMCACATTLFFCTSGFALAQGRGHDKDKRGDDDNQGAKHDDHGDHFYSDHDHDDMRNWYVAHQKHLPPGLAKKDQLPPGLERQLVVHGTLPPGLRSNIEPCPPELVRELPPPPPDYQHVIISGHIVLLNRKNFMIGDVFHFELN